MRTTLAAATRSGALLRPSALLPRAPALAVSLLTAANEASLVAHVLGAPDRIAALRRLYGFSIIATLCATEAWCYADAITAAPRLVSTHVPLFAILYHLHLLRMYVRRWARTRAL